MAEKKKKKRTYRRKTEKVPADKIQEMTGAAAEKLRKAGYNTIQKIARTQPQKLAKETGLKKPLARGIISSAKDACKGVGTETPSVSKEKALEAKSEKGLKVKEKAISEAMTHEGFRRRLVKYVVNNLFD